jgi:hypothetical protein
VDTALKSASSQSHRDIDAVATARESGRGEGQLLARPNVPAAEVEAWDVHAFAE